MAEIPEALTDKMLDGSERIRVGRRMRDTDGARTGPVRVWTTSILDIIKYAQQRVSPTVQSIAISAKNTLTYKTTNGEVKDLGSVQGPSITSGDGPPSKEARLDDLYIDQETGDLYKMEA